MPLPNTPLVSVLITTYQHSEYIAQALESVVGQACPFTFEVIVGDDGSTDGTRDVIRATAAAYPGIVVPYLPPHNLGHEGRVLFAQLLVHARGRYIAWLDGDDFWTSPFKLERQVDHLERHPACAMVFHNALWHLEGSAAPDRRFTRARRHRRLHPRELIRNNVVPPMSPMFRRSAIDPLPNWYVECPWGDWPLYVLASQRGTIDYLPHVMGVYRVHSRGMYSGMERLEVLRRTTLFYEQVHKMTLTPRDHRRAKQMLAASWGARGLEHLRLGDRASAGECLERCVRLTPAGMALAVYMEARRLLSKVMVERRSRK